MAVYLHFLVHDVQVFLSLHTSLFLITAVSFQCSLHGHNHLLHCNNLYPLHEREWNRVPSKEILTRFKEKKYLQCVVRVLKDVRPR